MVQSKFILYNKEYTVSPGDVITVDRALQAHPGQKAVLYSTDNIDTIYCEITKVMETCFTFIVEKIARKYNDVDTTVFYPESEPELVKEEINSTSSVTETESKGEQGIVKDTTSSVDINSMTKSKLLEFAEQNKIIVKPAMKKAEILDIIKKELKM